MSLLSSLTIYGSIDQVPAVWEMTHSLSAILALKPCRLPSTTKQLCYPEMLHKGESDIRFHNGLGETTPSY